MERIDILKIDILKKLEEVENVDLDGYGSVSLKYTAENLIGCIPQDFIDILKNMSSKDLIVLILAFQLSLVMEDDIIKDLNLSNSDYSDIYGVSDILEKIANGEAVIDELKSRIKKIMPDF